MTQTNDPPLISSLELIPDAGEKADLDAPNTSGGKLVIGQAPNITITETSVVADADERLALDVQEGDIAIQTNVSSSFIFTGGDNVANNWETIDFDAVGAIDGEDINPRDITPRNITTSGDITASGNISLQDLTVAGAFNGADTSAAAAGEALTADGTGGFSFASVGGDLVSLVTATPESVGGFVNSAGAMSVITASQAAMQNVASSQTAMQEVASSQTAMQEVATSQTAMEEVINSQTAMQEVRGIQSADQEYHLSDLYAVTLDTFAGINTGVTGGIDDIASSKTATQEVGLSATARSEIDASNTAKTAFNNVANGSGSDSFSGTRSKTIIQTVPETDNSPETTWIKEITVSSDDFESGFNADLAVQDDGTTVKQQFSSSITAGGFFALQLEYGTVSNGNSSGVNHNVTANYQYVDR